LIKKGDLLRDVLDSKIYLAISDQYESFDLYESFEIKILIVIDVLKDNEIKTLEIKNLIKLNKG